MDLEERFSRGDPDAFESLFRAHQHEVFRWINRIVRNPAAAEDLTVESLWQAFQARHSFDPSRPFLPWLRRIATNAALKHLGRSRREIALTAPAREPSPPCHAGPVGDRLEATNRAVRRLSPALRAVVLLGVIEEEPYAGIATALGISLPAVKSRMSRALAQLRKDLSKFVEMKHDS